MGQIKRAIISVSDKTDLARFGSFLAKEGVELISTGGTAKALRDARLTVIDVSEHTGFPEMMDGRVKTLHPTVHGGILAIRENAEHRQAMEAHEIKPVDLVVVNLYPFAKTVSDPNVQTSDAIENIDIGGPAMIRSAAKNHEYVTVVVDPSQYEHVMDAMQGTGMITIELRRRLMFEAFFRTACYDMVIAEFFKKRFKL